MPFITEESFTDKDGNVLVSKNEHKFEFMEEHIATPLESDVFYIFGKIKPQLKGLFLHREDIFKNDLKYMGKFGRYILMNTVNDISDQEDWAGLSGSPVINQEGKCFGILCSVNEGTKSVFVKPFGEILPFLNTIILQEKMKV